MGKEQPIFIRDNQQVLGEGNPSKIILESSDKPLNREVDIQCQLAKGAPLPNGILPRV